MSEPKPAQPMRPTRPAKLDDQTRKTLTAQRMAMAMQEAAVAAPVAVALPPAAQDMPASASAAPVAESAPIVPAPVVTVDEPAAAQIVVTSEPAVDASAAAAAAVAALAAVEKAEAIAIEQARLAQEQAATAAAAAPEVKPTPPSRPAARPRTSLLQAALANAAAPHREISPPAVVPMVVEESSAAAGSSTQQQQQPSEMLVAASTSPATNPHLITPSSGDWGAAGQLVTPAVAADFMPSESDANADFSSTFALSTSMREVEPRSELQHSAGMQQQQEQQQEQPQEQEQTEAVSNAVSDAEASDSDSDDEFFDAATYVAPKMMPPPLPTPTAAVPPSPVAAAASAPAASTPTASGRPTVVRDRSRMSLIMFAGLKTPTAASTASTAAPSTAAAAPAPLQVDTEPDVPAPRPIAWSTAGSGLVHISFAPGPADTILVGTFVDVHALPFDPEVAAAIRSEAAAHATATAAAHAASAAFLTPVSPSSPSSAAPVPASSPALAGASTPFLISKEILDTESRFIEILSALVEVFVAPIQAASHIRDESVAGSVALDSRVQVLFATATQILKLNVRFLEEIRRVIEAWLPSRREPVPPMGCPSIGSVFLNYAPLFRIFSSYAKDHETVAALLGAASKSKGSSWEKFVSRASMDPRCKGQTLESMLIQPVQRIPRYKLLLEELKRKCSSDSRGYNDLLASIAQVGEVALHVNETIRHREQNESLRQLEKCFSLTAATGFQRINLRDREPPRTLIKEGTLKRLTRKGHESYYFHLFNDILLYSDQISVAGRSTQFKLHRRISFEDSIAITDKSTVKPAQAAPAAAVTAAAAPAAGATVAANADAASQPTTGASDAKPLSTPASPALGATPAPPATPSSVSVVAAAAAASPAPSAAPATVQQYLIEIRSPAKSFIVSFDSLAQKDSWLSALQDCVRTVQESRGAGSSAFVAPVWTQDQAERKCPSCSKDFSLFNRRRQEHTADHCRSCGVLVCALCSKQKRMLPAVDKLKPVRVCDACVLKLHATLKAQKDGSMPPHPAALSKRTSTLGSLLSSTQPSGSTKGAAVARNPPPAAAISEEAADAATGYGAQAVAISDFDDSAAGSSAKDGSSGADGADSVEIPLHRRTLFTLARTYRGNERLLNVMELYLSERTYCLELQVILSDFVIPLLKQIQTKKGMLGGAPTTQLLGKAVPPTLLLFLNSVQPLATLSRELLNCLHAKLILGEGVPESVKSSIAVPPGWHPRYTTLGELFLRYASLFELYVEYSQNHQQALSLLTDPREPFAKEVFAKYDAAIRTKMDELITATQAVNAKAKAQEEGWGREDDAARVAAGLLPAALQPEGAEEATSFLANGGGESSSIGGPTAATPAARRASVARLSITGAAQPLVLDEPLPHTSLHDLLTAPFMRVSKYVWLLSSLLRATPEGHPDNIQPPKAAASGTAPGPAIATSPTNSASAGSAAAVAPASPSSSADLTTAAAATSAAPNSTASTSAPPLQLASALKAVQGSLFLINAAILCGDNLDKLSKLQSDKFAGSAKDLDLVAPNRHLLKEGYLLRHTRNGTTNYYFHLFSDMLTYSSITVQGKYKLHRKLPLLTLQILDTGGSLPAGVGTSHLSAPAAAAATAAALELEIRSPQKSFVVCAKNQMDKDEWLEEVQLAVQAELRRQTMGGAAVAAANAAEAAAAAAGGSATPALLRASSMVNVNGGAGAGVDDPAARRESVLLASAAPVWTKDSALDSCSLCTKKFTLFNRRHHCRVCGCLVCDVCSKGKKLVPTIDKDNPVRVCDKCGAK